MALNSLKCNGYLHFKLLGLKGLNVSNMMAFHSKADHPGSCEFSYGRMTFHSCDLDLDPVTLIYERKLDSILKVYFDPYQ